MGEHPVPPDDPLDDLLPTGPAGPGPERLRAALLAQTTRLLRRRRRLRHLALALLLVGSYAAGLATVRRGDPPPLRNPPEAARHHAGKPNPSAVATAHLREQGRGAPSSSGALNGPGATARPGATGNLSPTGGLSARAAPADVPALVLEWQAFDSPRPRPDLYRQAGDRYLEQEGDLSSALRCYRDVLETGSAEDRAVSPDDSWLLMALKQAKQREERHVQNGG